MKTVIKTIFPALLIILWTAAPLLSQDMRALQIKKRAAEDALQEQAASEKAAAEKAAVENRSKITQDRDSLAKAIAKIESANQQLKKTVRELDQINTDLDEQEAQVSEKLAQTDGMIKELVGVIRVSAKDIDALVRENPQSALANATPTFLDSLSQESRFPGMDDIRAMVDTLMDQTLGSAEVSLQKGLLMDRSGRKISADLLMLGPFTTIYRLEDEVGFCNYSSAGNKLYALSRLPSARMRKEITRYMTGQNIAVPMDISRGGALRQLTHELKLWEQVPKGGPIVWPILLILALGLLIVLERIIFLLRQHVNADNLINHIKHLSPANNRQACEQACQSHRAKPVARVIKAGLSGCHMEREEMENMLQEAILKEIPPMERFLSFLGILAAIAPLLGLLGTVTGMIDTFHVITLHGAGDPRLMSGGISEALVTTMLGLSVAIPLMLSATMLNRVVEKRIGEMEEKAVTLVNIIHKDRETL